MSRMIRVEVEVLGRVDRGDAGRLQRRDVGLGDDPADDDRRVDARARAARRPRSGISSRCEPERIDRPTTWTPSCSARRGDLRGRQPDALVDDVHAGVAGAHGDLLGAVGVAVEARLADEDLRAGARAPR